MKNPTATASLCISAERPSPFGWHHRRGLSGCSGCDGLKGNCFSELDSAWQPDIGPGAQLLHVGNCNSHYTPEEALWFLGALLLLLPFPISCCCRSSLA